MINKNLLGTVLVVLFFAGTSYAQDLRNKVKVLALNIHTVLLHRQLLMLVQVNG